MGPPEGEGAAEQCWPRDVRGKRGPGRVEAQRHQSQGAHQTHVLGVFGVLLSAPRRRVSPRRFPPVDDAENAQEGHDVSVGGELLGAQEHNDKEDFPGAPVPHTDVGVPVHHDDGAVPVEQRRHGDRQL